METPETQFPAAVFVLLIPYLAVAMMEEFHNWQLNKLLVDIVVFHFGTCIALYMSGFYLTLIAIGFLFIFTCCSTHDEKKQKKAIKEKSLGGSV